MWYADILFFFLGAQYCTPLGEKIDFLLEQLRMPPYMVEDFLMSELELARLCEGCPFPEESGGKRQKVNSGWKLVHEQFFSLFGMHWPPRTEHLSSFRMREAELIVAADFVFPESSPGEWKWFDANHTMERNLGFEVGVELVKDKLKNPWDKLLPTITTGSSIVGRILMPDGSSTFKALHPMEGFSMLGWGPEAWKQKPFSVSSLDKDDYMKMVGNAWTLYHYTPLMLAVFGAPPWAEVVKYFKDKRDQPEVVQSDDADCEMSSSYSD